MGSMSGSSSSMTHSDGPRVERLAHALILANDAGEAVAGWLAYAKVVTELAGFVAYVDADRRVPETCFRREQSSWLPIDLPPVALDELPTRAQRLELGGRRSGALADLLRTLSLDHAVLLPFESLDAGLLLLGRAGESFRDDELEAVQEAAGLLGTALVELSRRERRSKRENGAALEVAMLFELTRELAQAVDPERVVETTATTLSQLLGPRTGSVEIDLSSPEGTETATYTWPSPDAGGLATRIAAGEARPDSGFWVVPPSPTGRARIALSWSSAPPEAAARVAEAVLATLSMAVDRIESQRSKEEDRLRDAVEELPVGVALLSRSGRLRHANRTGRQVLESLGALPGEVDARLTKLGAVSLTPLLSEAAAGKTMSTEVFFPDESRTLVVRVVPAQNGLHQGTKRRDDVLLVLEDVTDALRQKRQLIHAEKLSALGELISGVVHELNNPLSTVLGYAQMLSGMPDAPSRTDWVRTILGEGQRCERIVKNMLALSRRQDGGRQLVSLGALAEKALSLVAYPYRTAGISASLRVDAEVPAVKGDPDGLLQLLINLLTNALHALEGHDGHREVRVELTRAGEGHVRIGIGDTGPGIEPEMRSQVFEAFFTTKAEGKGTGLGLSQVLATARDHEGRVTIEATEEGGALFLVDLPCGDGPGVEVVLPEPAAVMPVEPSLEGALIYVVDDEPAVAECLGEVLGQSGARVELFGNGAEALSRIEERAPDVLVSDLRMPEVSGEALLLELGRSAPELVDRVVLTTGDFGAASASETLRRFGRPCLSKPFDFAEVLATVASVRRHLVPPSADPTASAGLDLDGGS